MLEVFKTRPHFVPKVWGGHKLRDIFGKSVSAARRWGESWEVADLAEGESVVASGEFDGQTLGAMVDRFGAELVGTTSAGGRFPLLVKLLDAARDLSVQVHPGPDDLARHPGAQSKDECWVILDADEGGAILHGLRDAVSPATFRDAVRAGTVVDLLRRIEVSPGDVFRISPGTIHAICAGVALLEIQEPSDTTYRVYDYERPGLDGEPRELHLDDALDVAHLEPSSPSDNLGLERPPDSMLDGAEVLANVDAYRVESLRPLRQGGETSWSIDPHTPQVLYMLRGEACVNGVRLVAGETAIVPAARGRAVLTDSKDCQLIAAGLGGPPLFAPERPGRAD